MTKIYLYSVPNQGDSTFAEGLRAVLASTGRFQFECIAGAFDGLLARLRSGPPDVLLMDMQPETMARALGRIGEAAPRSKPVLCVEHISAEMAVQAMKLGVEDILIKSLAADSVLECVLRTPEFPSLPTPALPAPRACDPLPRGDRAMPPAWFRLPQAAAHSSAPVAAGR
jgi:DNA-binding NtrC family response regulator